MFNMLVIRDGSSRDNNDKNTERKERGTGRRRISRSGEKTRRVDVVAKVMRIVTIGTVWVQGEMWRNTVMIRAT